VRLYSYSQTTPEWREWAFISEPLGKVLRMVEAGEASPVRRVVAGIEQCVGFQRTTQDALKRSPCTLTRSTLFAVSGEKPNRMEVVKFLVWPLIGDTRATCVRPRISDVERREAERLLGTGGR
jgi:hypothetical protein